MNFTSDIKKEIIGVRRASAELAEKKASISAFVKTSGTIGIKDGTPTFFLVSETENVAEYFMAAFSKVFGVELSITRATWDRMSGRDKLLLQCPAAKTEYILRELALLQDTGEALEGISEESTATDGEKIAYVQGAFLGGGSCTIPTEAGKSGYHLEFVFSDEKTAWDFCELLSSFELLARTAQRKETWVVYIKSKEQISDFLAVVGAVKSLKKFSAVLERRDSANQKNRAQNCMAGNADKTAIAAVKQVVALRKLQESGRLSDLSEELQSLARARMDNPAKSLQELANDLKISKSCLNHRMRRLLTIAGSTAEKK